MPATRATKPPPLEKAVELDVDSVPGDPDVLRAALREMQKHARAALAERNLLRERLERELRAKYGPRSERSGLLGSPGQSLMPFLEEALLPAPPGSASPSGSSSPGPSPEATTPPASEPATKNKPTGRRALPATLERRKTVIDVPEADRVCLCCKSPLRRIGEDTRERLEYEPASLFVLLEERPKYACAACADGVLSAEPSPAPIARGLAGPGLLAHVVVSKYQDHLPLHRQEHIFERLGVALSRSTMADWMGGVADLLAPVYEALKRDLLASAVIGADETKLPVQGEKAGRLDNAWLWVYASAERGVTLFECTRTRGSKEPLRFLEGWRGTLLTDDYGGYKPCHARGMTEAGCWAHARRKFHDAKATDPPRAEWMIAAIARLYAIEKDARDLPPEERAGRRRALARPVLEEIRAWLDREARATLPRSSIGVAIAYTRDRWAALTRYVDDGRIEIDNNRCERALRDVVIGRKNWLFAGSDEGGRRAAVLYSLIACCKQCGVEPWAYLKDLLERLPTFRGDPGTLTPARWALSRS